MPVREVHGLRQAASMLADLGSYRRFQADHVTRLKGIHNVKTEIPMQKSS